MSWRNRASSIMITHSLYTYCGRLLMDSSISLTEIFRHWECLNVCLFVLISLIWLTMRSLFLLLLFFHHHRERYFFNPISWHRYGYSANFEMLNELTRILYCFCIQFCKMCSPFNTGYFFFLVFVCLKRKWKRLTSFILFGFSFWNWLYEH